MHSFTNLKHNVNVLDTNGRILQLMGSAVGARQLMMVSTSLRCAAAKTGRSPLRFLLYSPRSSPWVNLQGGHVNVRHSVSAVGTAANNLYFLRALFGTFFGITVTRIQHVLVRVITVFEYDTQAYVYVNSKIYRRF